MDRHAPTLYLDYDGVLHPDAAFIDRHNRPYLVGPGRLFMWAERLEAALAPHPEVAIVLSTSWTTIKGFSKTRKRLPASLRERVIGATWHSSFKTDYEIKYWWEQSSRCDQILADVMRRRPRGWLAIDDDDTQWVPAYREHLVHCDHTDGLGSTFAQQKLAQGLKALVAGERPLPLPFQDGTGEVLKRRGFPSF